MRKHYFFALFAAALLSLAALSTKELMPEFLELSDWFNVASPLSRKDFQGKVAVIGFWNDSRPEGLRAVTQLQQWALDYETGGFEALGIFCPEFDFQKEPDRLERLSEKLGLNIPLAVDAEARMWKSYNVQSNPSFYVIDAHGRIRHSVQGVSAFGETEKTIRDLLTESGRAPAPKQDSEPPKPAKLFSSVDFGYKHAPPFGNEGGIRAGTPQTFKKPESIGAGFFYLDGKWRFEEDKIHAASSPTGLVLKLRAKKIYILAGSVRDKPSGAKITLDGNPVPAPLRGADAAGQGDASMFFVKDYRFYEILNAKNSAERTVEIRFEEPGIEIYRVSGET